MRGTAPADTPSGKTVEQAVRSFLEDKDQQALSQNWLAKLKRELNDLASYCNSKVVLLLSDVGLQTLEDYRKTWTGEPISRRKRQERLRQFFTYCQKHRWILDNPAANLSTIKVKQAPTSPLSREQFRAALDAVDSYHPRGPNGPWRRERATAMLLLLRWSGLRIGDAARLERSSLTDRGMLRLYTQKTGEGVYVPLPPDVVSLLRKLPNENQRYFFWNGSSDVNTPGMRWWGTLKTIFSAAGMPEVHPHMLRDTFAVEMLLAGVPLEQVSILLGHSTIRVTEKHYSPWVRTRQERLEESVQKAWTSAGPIALDTGIRQLELA